MASKSRSLCRQLAVRSVGRRWHKVGAERQLVESVALPRLHVRIHRERLESRVSAAFLFIFYVFQTSAAEAQTGGV